jgi:cell division protein FtsI (penicillin-binding protein 3)
MNKEIRFRVYITFLAMLVVGGAIVYKAARIQVREGKELIAHADSMHTKLQTIDPERGNIYSEDGSLLASTVPQFDIHIDFSAIPNDTFQKYQVAMAKSITRILNDERTATDFLRTLQSAQAGPKPNRYFLLKKKANYEQYMALRAIQPFCQGQNKGGFIVDVNNKRINPYGLLANRVVGIWRKNGKTAGLEREYDSDLSGTQGQRVLRCIAGGVWMPIDGSEIDPKNGNDVHTTLDVNIQDVAENALLEQVRKEKAEFGTCIVMEVKTGKIKAMANLGRQANDTAYLEDFNYALKLMEPGSTFKLVSLISLFKDKKISINDMIDCHGGSFRFGPYTIRDSHHGLGRLTIKEAFAQSSNVAFARLIYENYNNNMGAYWRNLSMLGLDKKTGIGLMGEPKARFTKDSVSKGHYQLAYQGMGYHTMITPLHTCMIYNAIANQGKMMKPYLVNKVVAYGNDVLVQRPEVASNFELDSQAVAQIKSAMLEVVESGTGKALKNPYYTICGKTGTAQVADVRFYKGADGKEYKEKIHYSDRMYHGSFVGFFPNENPEYTICVVLRTRKGSSNYYGGQIALPVFKEVANRLYAIKMHPKESLADRPKRSDSMQTNTVRGTDYNTLCGIMPLKKTTFMPSDWLAQSLDSAGRTQSVKRGLMLAGMVPNVSGMGLRDALFVLEKAGFKVNAQGKGRVIHQSIAPGKFYGRGEKIVIQLS